MSIVGQTSKSIGTSRSATEIAKAIEDLFETTRSSSNGLPMYRAYPGDHGGWDICRAGDRRGRWLFSRERGPVVFEYRKDAFGQTRVAHDLIVPEGFTVYCLVNHPTERAREVELHGRRYFLTEPRYCPDAAQQAAPGSPVTNEIYARLGVKSRLVPSTDWRVILHHFSRSLPYGLTSMDHASSGWGALHLRFDRPVLRNIEHFRRYIDDPEGLWQTAGMAAWQHRPNSVNRLGWLRSRAMGAAATEDAARTFLSAVNENYKHLVVCVFVGQGTPNGALSALLDRLRSTISLQHEVVAVSTLDAIPGPTKGSLLCLGGNWRPPDAGWCTASRINAWDLLRSLPDRRTSTPVLRMEDCRSIVTLYGIGDLDRWGYRDPFAWDRHAALAQDLERMDAISTQTNTMTPGDEREHPSLTPEELHRRFADGQQCFWTSSQKSEASALTVDIDIKRGRKKVPVGTRWLEQNVNWSVFELFEAHGLLPVFRLSGTGIYVEYFFGGMVPAQILDQVFLMTSRLFCAEPVRAIARGSQPPRVVLRRGRKTLTLDMVSTHGLCRLPGSVHHSTGRVSRWLRPNGHRFLEIKDFDFATMWIRDDRTSCLHSSIQSDETTPIISLPSSLQCLLNGLPAAQSAKKIMKPKASQSPEEVPIDDAANVSSIGATSSGGLLSLEEMLRLSNALLEAVLAAPQRGPKPQKSDRVKMVVERVVRVMAQKREFDLAHRELARLVADTDTKQVRSVMNKIVATGLLEPLDPEWTGRLGGKHAISRYRVRASALQALLLSSCSSEGEVQL